MNICQNCEVETKNKKFCSNSCTAKWQIENGKRNNFLSSSGFAGGKHTEAAKQKIREWNSSEEGKTAHRKTSESLKIAYATGRRVVSPLCTNWKNPDLRGQRISKTKKEKMASNPEERAKISSRVKKDWENPEYAKRVLGRREMSSPEKYFLDNYINSCNLPYYFNGTLSAEGHHLTINRKVPDFVHNSENKLIEIWGDHFHKGQNPQDRIDLFKKNGYSCIVIWASELKDKEKVLERISRF